MDEVAGVFLNDAAKTLYTYAAQLPHLKRANQDLEMKLLIFGASVQRINSDVIDVAANALTVTLPDDFLLPLELWERRDGGSNDDWVPMSEVRTLPEVTPGATNLVYWSFENNAINLVGAAIATEVLLKYERQLAVITGQNSPEDFTLSKNYLSARTAELCARYIGMNKEMADDIAAIEVGRSEDDLLRALTLNQQGIRARRPHFRTQYPSIR